MRIIAGIYKSRVLLAPKGKATRPTAEVVREAVFSILGDRLAEARVWDVFAGSGAMGLEALSRGAAGVLFTEASPEALKAVKINLGRLGESKARLALWRAPQGLARLGLEPAAFDLIFLDPPYNSSLASQTLAAIAEAELAAPRALALWEHDRRLEPGPLIPPAWELLETRRWGRRAVSFIKPAGPGLRQAPAP